MDRRYADVPSEDIRSDSGFPASMNQNDASFVVIAVFYHSAGPNSPSLRQIRPPHHPGDYRNVL
ncbi:MAG: hypothetical protein R6V02_09530 [Candidatus Aminicenantes bacterium]